MTINLM
jgi:O-phospho-L-seryl-tRNASec:L-selenocysteinyl-tRNA synthase